MSPAESDPPSQVEARRFGRTRQVAADDLGWTLASGKRDRRAILAVLGVAVH